ncbi:Protein gts1 [Elasticomyces elasticus]|nr:Protein gts1 [Elasticomyces elasticus]KAK3650301.1 Protein gts1 [Elasticomyces elasticus]KAK4932312.1 Protein gts1 [Elasticomyces elasticus]KAK5768320.1 Protein gts1 [Elasticomyces elasticus]
MTSAISKRQQARNERALQELLTLPGNDRCADCAAKNPGWASWNLGVFLCMRCGGLHRKLGTHVSKVKSLSMDSWSAEQVENMKKVGNVEGNKRWNPKGTRPELPVDADEVDSAIERFIRQKYEQRAFTTGGPAPPTTSMMRQHTTGSTGTGSWNEEPPPLPPKPGKKFGFSLRSASSIFPRGNKNERNFTPPLSPTYTGSDFDPPSPVRAIKSSNKPSQMFGMKMSISNNFDAKLASLRDMGFSDNRRNSEVLKSTNGSLEQAIEALVRLGEGAGNQSQQVPTSRNLTPVSIASQGVNGISIEKTRQKPNNNPWELVESSVTPKRAATQPLPEPPRSQSAQPATSNHWNPFLSQAQPQQSLVDNFQNLQVSQTGPSAPQQYAQQQAFGGAQAQYQQNNPFQQASAIQQAQNPWDSLNMPQQQQQYQQPPADPNYGQQYRQPQIQQQQAPVQQTEQTSNPFLRKAASQTFVPSNPWGQQQQQQQMVQPQQISNPWGQPAQQQQAPPVQQASNPFGMPYTQQPKQQSVFQQAHVQSPGPMLGQAEYFAQQQQQNQQAAQQLHQQQLPWDTQTQTQAQQPVLNLYHQQQQMMPQQTGMPQQFQAQQPAHQEQQQPWMYREVNPQPQAPARLDKSSILGLYGMAPRQQQPALQPVMEDSGAQQQSQMFQQNQQSQMFQQNQQSLQQAIQQDNVTFNRRMEQQDQQRAAAEQEIFLRDKNERNPLTGSPKQGPRHVSNESAAFVGFAGEGRHSPDAFSGLSARYAR